MVEGQPVRSDQKAKGRTQPGPVSSDEAGSQTQPTLRSLISVPYKVLRTLVLRTLVPRTLVPRTLVPRTLVLRTLVPRTLVPRTVVPRTALALTRAGLSFVESTLYTSGLVARAFLVAIRLLISDFFSMDMAFFLGRDFFIPPDISVPCTEIAKSYG